MARAKPIPYVVEREGRFWARIVIPADLRPIFGKNELREALGGDRAEARRKSAAVVQGFLDQIEMARSGRKPPRPAPVKRALSPAGMAHMLHAGELAIDARDRLFPELVSTRQAEADLFRPAQALALRRVASGLTSDDETAAIIGWAIDRFRAQGNTTVEPSTLAWRELAQTLALAQLDSLDRRGERDRGDFTGKPALPVLMQPAPDLDKLEPVSIMKLTEDYFADRKRFGKAREAKRLWTPRMRTLVGFLKHDDATAVTKADIERWLDAQMQTISARTVQDGYLSAAKAVFAWARRKGRIATDPTMDIKKEMPKQRRTRNPGFSDDEAITILKAADAYTGEGSNEGPLMTAAKRWVPWLCAFTGARVGEISQLRTCDVQERDGITFLSITPEAGSTKTDEHREVPIHEQLVERGFLDFVKTRTGALFFDDSKSRKPGARHPSKRISDMVGKRIREIGITDPGIRPNHAWRHRFKSQADEMGISQRIYEDIQGWAPRTTSQTYGAVTLKAKAAAIARFPRYDLDGK